jgi:hypothetical protein
MSLLDVLMLPAAADVPAPIRGVALLGLVVLGGVGGVVTILLVAWSRHRRTASRAGTTGAGRGGDPPQASGVDPWEESARRIPNDAGDREP